MRLTIRRSVLDILEINLGQQEVVSSEERYFKNTVKEKLITGLTLEQ